MPKYSKKTNFCKTIVTALVLNVVTFGPVYADIFGVWQGELNGSKSTLEISPCGDLICGELENSTIYISNMVPNGTSFEGGTVYSPAADEMLPGKLELLSEDVLKVSTCIAGGMLCRSKNWQRN